MNRFLRPALAVVALAVVVAPLSVSGANFTSSSDNAPSTATASVDWTPPSVSLVNPGVAIRRTATITANASDAETGVAQVVLQWAPEGSTTWTTLCTRTTGPYSCPFDTSAIADGYVHLRAVATDNAGQSTAAVLEDVLVDNTAPTASMDDPGSPLRGTVTLAVTASDAGSGVASAAIQYAPAGTTSWTTACTVTAAPFSCRFDTTKLADGAYDLRAQVTDVAGNATTTGTVRNRQVDNRTASISMEDPGAFLRGTVTLTASAFSPTGITSVRIQRAATGTTSWVDVCTTTAVPPSCSWNTTTVTDGGYDFRAILLDGSGKTTTSAVLGPRQVDNTVVRGADVQATGAGTLGRLDAGDQFVLTYTEVMRPSSIIPGWDGSSRSIALRLRNGTAVALTGSDDTVDFFTDGGLRTPVTLGAINLESDYIKTGKTGTFNATIVRQSVVVNGTNADAFVVTVGTAISAGNGVLRTSSATPAMVWTPSSTATDVAGNPCSAAPVTESGAADRDL